jgi:ribosomal protein L37AE/L43A
MVEFLKAAAAKGEAYIESLFPPDETESPRDELLGKRAQLEIEMKVRGIQPVPANAYVEPREACPNCSATCTVRLFGAVWRCNQCGVQWGDAHVERPPSRKSLSEAIARHGGF